VRGRTNIGAQSYTYNGLGDRVRVDKPTGTRHFVYDALSVFGGRVIAEYGSSAADVKAEFIWALPPAANDNSPFGGGDHIAGYAPLALVAKNASNQLELYWVHGDHIGVPVVTTNAQGQVVTPANDFLRPGFPGQSQVLADLYHNRARDYDPVPGRYIQADPIGLGGGINPYIYANSDPVNLIDPTGEAWFVILPAIAGGGNLAYQLYHNGGQFDCVDWWQVGDTALMGTGYGGAVRALATRGGRRIIRDILRDESGAVPIGRQGAQKRLRELANDPKLSSRDRGWIEQELNQISRGKRRNIRRPPGMELAHRRGREARRGYDYSHSDLQDIQLHRTQHRIERRRRQ
jgi:RHS repeat-associated protein